VESGRGTNRRTDGHESGRGKNTSEGRQIRMRKRERTHEQGRYGMEGDKRDKQIGSGRGGIRGGRRVDGKKEETHATAETESTWSLEKGRNGRDKQTWRLEKERIRDKQRRSLEQEKRTRQPDVS
jgi:hypothetical protein